MPKDRNGPISEGVGVDWTSPVETWEPPIQLPHRTFIPCGPHLYGVNDWVDPVFIVEGVGVRPDSFGDGNVSWSHVQHIDGSPIPQSIRKSYSTDKARPVAGCKDWASTSSKIKSIYLALKGSKMLSDQAIIATLVGRVWRAQQYDKQVTGEIVKAKNTNKDAGRFNKNLMPGEPLLKQIKQKLAEVRHYHYAVTLPWEWKGGQLLPGKLYMPYSAEIGKLIDEFDDLCDQFCEPTYYQNAIDEAEKSLGDLFNPHDYPSSTHIRDTFFSAVEYMSVPSTGDYRIDLPAEELAKLKENHLIKERQIVSDATKHLYTKLKDLARHAEDRLKDPRNVFHNTLPENIKKFTDIVPELNIEDDQNLNQLAQELQQAVGVHDAETLREDEVVRSDAAKDAGSIVDQIKSQMGAFAS